ncbi:MAG: hypothetical protein CFE24_01810 [Flavobacterium sp. BFFFF2]|nr:MAG: hypothetical protein CFE24_01810 [Flavobacterium sp. BFFFF2]
MFKVKGFPSDRSAFGLGSGFASHRSTLRVSGQVSGFRFQVSGFRFQVSGFASHRSSLRASGQVSGFRFQVSGFVEAS